MALRFNAVLNATGSSAPIPLRWQVTDNELAVMAAPDKGDPQEVDALDEIDALRVVLETKGIPFIFHSRKHDGGYRPDCVRIPHTKQIVEIAELLPAEVKPHLALLGQS